MTELNNKELKLLRLVCNEYKNAEIAEELGYGLRHIEKMKTALYKKTGVTSALGLLKWAVLNKHYFIKRRYSSLKSSQVKKTVPRFSKNT